MTCDSKINLFIVNTHIAVVSILTFPMILYLTCKIRMRKITGCANTGAKTVQHNKCWALLFSHLIPWTKENDFILIVDADRGIQYTTSICCWKVHFVPAIYYINKTTCVNDNSRSYHHPICHYIDPNFLPKTIFYLSIIKVIYCKNIQNIYLNWIQTRYNTFNLTA
jgi:hypothetical protein